MCLAEADGWLCTLARGHTGQHVACVDDDVHAVAVWDEDGVVAEREATVQEHEICILEAANLGFVKLKPNN